MKWVNNDSRSVKLLAEGSVFLSDTVTRMPVRRALPP